MWYPKKVVLEMCFENIFYEEHTLYLMAALQLPIAVLYFFHVKNILHAVSRLKHEKGYFTFVEPCHSKWIPSTKKVCAAYAVWYTKALFASWRQTNTVWNVLHVSGKKILARHTKLSALLRWKVPAPLGHAQASCKDSSLEFHHLKHVTLWWNLHHLKDITLWWIPYSKTQSVLMQNY